MEAIHAEEALLALSNSTTMREAGIDEAFAARFARNCAKWPLLSESTQRKIAAQFAHHAAALSYCESVGRKHCPDKERALVDWLKGVNLLLALQREPAQV